MRISAVIPTYNRAHTIVRAIDSILGQKYTSFEIIVVDDGSSDNTRKRLEAYGEKVRYVYQENKGVSAARNRGVSEAKAEWVAFLDSDDYWMPFHLENMVSAIKDTKGNASLYFSDTMHSQEYSKDSLWNLCQFSIVRPFLFKKDASEWAFMRIQPMMLQSSVISKEIYWEVGGLPENLLTREDTFLFFKLALQYPVCAVSGCGAIMKSDGTRRLSRIYDGNSLVFWQSSIKLYRLLLASEKRIADKYQKLLNQRLSHSYFSLGRFYWRRNDFIMASRSLLVAAWISPHQFTKQIIDKLI